MYINYGKILKIMTVIDLILITLSVGVVWISRDIYIKYVKNARNKHQS